MDDVDYSDIDFEILEHKDPCTSKTCKDLHSCLRYSKNAKPTLISEKLKASNGHLCPYFDADLSRYPKELHHPLLVWPDREEELYLAALGWFRTWRRTNDFTLKEDDGFFAKPVEPQNVWLALKPRILDWAWFERGGADLTEIHKILSERQKLRWKDNPSKQYPTLIPKENHNGSISKQSIPDRKLREGCGTKSKRSRTDHEPILVGYD